MAALGQWKELIVKAHSTSHQYEVVGHSPPDAFSLIHWPALLIVVFFVNVWGPYGYAGLDAHATVEARKPHPVAKGMCQDTCVDIAGADEDKGGEESKERSVGELEERASNGHN